MHTHFPTQRQWYAREFDTLCNNITISEESIKSAALIVIRANNIMSSEEFYNGKTFRLKSDAMGNLPAFGGISDYEYMERLLSDKEPPKQQPQREQSPYEKYATLDPTGIRAIIEYIKPRCDAMQPKIRELFQQNWKNENYFADKSRSAKLEIQCTFCDEIKEWKYDEIQNHIESHNAFKTLIEKIRVTSKKEDELYTNKHAAQRK